MKIQCKRCKRFFSDDPMTDMDGSFEILKDKVNNPMKLCAICLDKYHRGNIDTNDAMNLTSHKGDSDYWSGRKQ